MDEENKELFDSIEESEFLDEVPTEEAPAMVDAPDEEEVILGDLSDIAKKEIILKVEDLDEDGCMIVEIESAELGKPKLKDADGNPIPPKQFNETDASKKGYETKIKIEFKDNNYISLIPNVKWYLGTNKEGKKTLNPWFRTTGLKEADLEDKYVSEASKTYYRYCKFMGQESGKISQAEFIKGLAGKKAKIKQWSDTFKKEKVYRIDIVEFLE